MRYTVSDSTSQINLRSMGFARANSTAAVYRYLCLPYNCRHTQLNLAHSNDSHYFPIFILSLEYDLCL